MSVVVTGRRTARWTGMETVVERLREKLARTCGRCGHALGSHEKPDPERGVPHFPPQACRVKSGCACILFVPAGEVCDRWRPASWCSRSTWGRTPRGVCR
jgi:hypothetical protein